MSPKKETHTHTPPQPQLPPLPQPALHPTPATGHIIPLMLFEKKGMFIYIK